MASTGCVMILSPPWGLVTGAYLLTHCGEAVEEPHRVDDKLVEVRHHSPLLDGGDLRSTITFTNHQLST